MTYAVKKVVTTDILKKAAAGTFLGGSLLFTAGLGMANAQPVEAPDGLVTVAVGDVAILQGVSTDTAATAAGAICGTQVPEVNALAVKVDAQGAQQIVCEGLPGGALAIQNASVSAEQPQASNSAETPQESPVDAPAEPADAAPVKADPADTR